MKAAAADRINWREYPQLSRLCWNEHLADISAEDAFHRYLDQWPHVNKIRMAPHEIALIRRLNQAFSHRLDVHEITPSAH